MGYISSLNYNEKKTILNEVSPGQSHKHGSREDPGQYSPGPGSVSYLRVLFPVTRLGDRPSPHLFSIWHSVVVVVPLG